MVNDAITAGVRLGGLTDRTEIKILLCYLLRAVKQPLTLDQLVECVCGQELVNYFELQSALGQLLENGLIKEDEKGFSILPQGADVASELEGGVSSTVKRYAYTMAVNLLQYEAMKKQNSYEITAAPNGFNLHCIIADGKDILFSVDILMPDEKSARYAGEQFIMKGQDIYRCVLGITTDTPSMYEDFLKNGK